MNSTFQGTQGTTAVGDELTSDDHENICPDDPHEISDGDARQQKNVKQQQGGGEQP